MDYSHRKVSKKIRIVDAQGNAVANKEISVKQTNHKFLFGCGGFVFMPYIMSQDEEMSKKFANIPGFQLPSVEQLKKVTDSWLEIFNYATLPFYWGNFEPEEGKPMTDLSMKMAKYLQSQNVKIKGHPLCWHTVCAPWLLKYDNKTIFEKQLARIDREVSGFKGVIDMWDVINEVVIMPVFDKYDNAITRICKEKGRVPLVKAVFDEAHAMNPDAVLLLNDFNTSEKYEHLIEECLDAGVPISAIGIQSHQHQGYWGREKLEEILSRYERFGLPIHFTENTLISGEIMPAYIEDLNDWQVESWPSTPEGEERQAREVEEMYRILFSHPQVEAITSWDYKDGAWLKAPSGFLRLDDTKKPSYYTLKKLIREEWWTDEKAVTDAEGYVTVSAFKGEYEIAADGKAVSAELVDDSDLTITLS